MMAGIHNSRVPITGFSDSPFASMDANMESNELSAWKPVAPPPPGYFQVVRRTFDTGLHVLVLVSQRGADYVVLSSIDHGTAKPSLRREGSSHSVAGTIDILRGACGRWNETAAVDTPVKPPHKEYFHVDDAGKISGPVSREELFGLIRSGTITWESQVWEVARALTSLGDWRPVLLALGFPPVQSPYGLE